MSGASQLTPSLGSIAGANDAQLRELSHHCAPRTDAELGEDPTDMSVDRPQADLEHCGNRLLHTGHGGEMRVTFIVTASHRAADVDAAAAVLRRLRSAVVV